MVIIVGLGNPGKKYQSTRHNIGFLVVDEFAKRNNFPDFKISKKFNALISENFLDNKKIILAKPETFMNESGKAVKLLTYNLQLTTDNLWVVHDDLDLPLGKMRISLGRGSAGHKGVESIIKELKTKNFVRFRMGVKPINNQQLTINKIEYFVLKKFTKDEEKILKEVIEKACESIEFYLIEGLEKTMTKFNV